MLKKQVCTIFLIFALSTISPASNTGYFDVESKVDTNNNANKIKWLSIGVGLGCLFNAIGLIYNGLHSSIMASTCSKCKDQLSKCGSQLQGCTSKVSDTMQVVTKGINMFKNVSATCLKTKEQIIKAIKVVGDAAPRCKKLANSCSHASDLLREVLQKCSG